MQEALAVVKSYCEQSYNTVSCAIMPDGRLRMTFSAGGAGSRLEEYRTATMEAAIAVHDQLWESGELTASMTDTERPGYIIPGSVTTACMTMARGMSP